MTEDSGEVTQLLQQLNEGGANAEAKLYRLAYDRLRRIAGAHVRRGGHMLSINPTALVSEAYVKMRPVTLRDVASSTHFYRIMSRAMRQVIVDLIRKKTAKKVADHRVVTLEDGIPDRGLPYEELLALDSALDALENIDKDLAQLVEWRFYGGLDVDEIAVLMGVTDRTVRRKWLMAKVLLSESLEN